MAPDPISETHLAEALHRAEARAVLETLDVAMPKWYALDEKLKAPKRQRAKELLERYGPAVERRWTIKWSLDCAEGHEHVSVRGERPAYDQEDTWNGHTMNRWVEVEVQPALSPANLFTEEEREALRGSDEEEGND